MQSTTTINTETHHMVDDERPLQQAFTKFFTAFPYSRCQFALNQEAIVYEVKHLSFARQMLKDAQKVIRDYVLPIKARLSENPIEAMLIIEAE